MKILVCDDQAPNCNILVETIKGAISEEATVEGLSSDELLLALETFFRSIEAFMKNGSNNTPVEETQFDGADLVVLDNNLTHLNVSGTRLTAESIAGYIRAFSTGTYIISINKNPDVDFDLRFLVGDYKTQTDLALNEEHLGNRALWTGDPSDADDGFFPWYWPKLNDVFRRREEQISFVHKRLDQEVLSSLGFDDDAIGCLSHHAKGALPSDAGGDGGGGCLIKTATFSDLFLKTDSLPIPADREHLHTARESPEVSMIIARVVAAYIDRWFRRDVLGPQEGLVDLPHLLVRLPFILGDKARDFSEWNDSIAIDRAPYNLDARLYEEHIESAKFEHHMWNKGPCFWWPKLKRNDELNELFLRAPNGAWADVAFCEDRSSFVDRSSKDRGDLLEFSAEFEGNWKRRYVQCVPGKQYSPRTRLVV